MPREADWPDGGLNIDREVEALGRIFSTVSRSDFYHLDNGNIGATIGLVPTTGEVDRFDILIEYPPLYPRRPPRMWITEPEIDAESGLVEGYDEYEQAQADYLATTDWDASLTSYHAVRALESWIAAYCQWLREESQDDIDMSTTLQELAAEVKRYRTRTRQSPQN